MVLVWFSGCIHLCIAWQATAGRLDKEWFISVLWEACVVCVGTPRPPFPTAQWGRAAPRVLGQTQMWALGPAQRGATAASPLHMSSGCPGVQEMGRRTRIWTSVSPAVKKDLLRAGLFLGRQMEVFDFLRLSKFLSELLRQGSESAMGLLCLWVAEAQKWSLEILSAFLPKAWLALPSPFLTGICDLIVKDLGWGPRTPSLRSLGCWEPKWQWCCSQVVPQPPGAVWDLAATWDPGEGIKWVRTGDSLCLDRSFVRGTIKPSAFWVAHRLISRVNGKP